MEFSKTDIDAGGSLIQGDTCYLNNVKQKLFKGFTEAVERHNSCMDRLLKDLFDELQRHTAGTNTILKKLGIDRVWEQQDAAEFYVKILTQTSEDASQIFHGELTHTTICGNPQCGAQKPTDSRFWHLPLTLTDSYDEEYQVVNGINEFFRDSHFSGLDQMFCEECDDKVDATVKCEVKHHPEVLVLLLKRFDFDYRYMRYVKNNRAVIVPSTLNIPENQTYELYAVVDHVGDLRGGHYAAVIKSQDDDRWYIFNDGSVSLYYQLFQLDHTERSHSAYLLFYRKQTSETLNERQTSAVKYHGLINQGATCYLNSLLQVLFMTREFREAVNRHIRTLDHHLRGLLKDLHRHTVDTCDIIINTVFEPQEAAEYVQRISAPSMHQASQAQTRCCKCETGRSRESPLWHLPLTLMDSNSEEYSLVDGLNQSLTDQVSCCEQCGSTIDVITKCEVKPHPEVLVLLLKRFDFDFRNMTFVRNNQAVNMTQTLQISENQTYELYAVVDHVGDLRGGHHAVIKPLNDGQWYNFYNNTHASPFQHGDTETSQTVHLLFYRRQGNKRFNHLSATSETNQSPHTETIRQREEVKEAVEEGSNTAETVSTGKNEETQIMEDQDRGAGVRQLEPHSEEDRDGNKTDEEEIMRHDDENMRKNRETDDPTDKTDTETKETTENQDDNGVDDINNKTPRNQDLAPELVDLRPGPVQQYDQIKGMDEKTAVDEQSENLDTENQVSERIDDVRLTSRQHVDPCVDNRELTEGNSTVNESDVLPSEGFLPATSDTDKQSPRTETKRPRDEVEEVEEEGDDAAETVATGEKEETQTIDKSVKPEAHVCNVEDQDRGAGVTQREPHTEEHSDGNTTDEQEIMRHNDENMRRNGEIENMTDKTDTVIKESEERAEDLDDKGHENVQKQYDMSRDQSRVMDEQTLGDKQSENLHREQQVSEGADDVGLKIRRVDNRDFTDNESEPKRGNDPKHTDDGWAREQEHEMRKDDAEKRGDEDYAQVREKSKRKHDREGLDVDDPQGRKASGVDSSDTEFGENKEIQNKKKQKREDDDGAGVKTQNKSNHNNTCQRESRHFAPREGKSDDRNGRSRRRSGRSSDGGKVEQRIQESTYKHTDVQNKDVKVRQNVHGETREGDVMRSIIDRTDSDVQRKKARTEEEPSHDSKNRREQNEVKSDLETNTLTQAVHRSNLKEAPEPETSKKTRRDTGRREKNETMSHLNEEEHAVQIENKEDDEEKSLEGREKNDSDDADAQICHTFYSAKGNVLEMKGQSKKQRGKKRKCCFKTKKARTERVEDTSHSSKKHRETKESGEKSREKRGAWSKISNLLKPRRKVDPQNSEEGSDGEGSLMGGRGGMENRDSKKQRKTPCWHCACCICGTC